MHPPTLRLAWLVPCLALLASVAPVPALGAPFAVPESAEPPAEVAFDSALSDPAPVSALHEEPVWFDEAPPVSVPDAAITAELLALDYPEEMMRDLVWLAIDQKIGRGVNRVDSALGMMTEAWILLAAPLLSPAFLRITVIRRRQRKKKRRRQRTWADQALEELERVEAEERAGSLA